MRGTLTLTFATTVAIGMLALGVGALTVTSNLQTVQAANPNCAPYGQLVSEEARRDNARPGYGEEVAPLAQADGSFGQNFRQPGERPSFSSTCGNSNVG
jgi:hypothetical protein